MEQTNESQKLSTFMKVSIAILAVVTLASISLLFIGDFQGKFERVISTVLLFAVFVLLTAFDTRKERRNEWYAPVALIANAYILGLLLIVIWVTPYRFFDLAFEILWKSAFVIGTTRLVLFGVELLLKVGRDKPTALGRWGQATSIFGVLTLIMFTAPIGIEAFGAEVPSLYWKFAVATLIITALGLAITLLLNWYYRSTGNAAKPAYAYSQGNPAVAQAPASQGPLLPWPTHPDGTPYPMLPNGQPDFSVETLQAQQTQAAPAEGGVETS